MRRRPRVAGLWLVLAALAAPALAQDRDRDGLADALEQALLERFLPTFVLSAGECAGQPASFLPDRRDPLVAASDGTIYGHVAVHRRPGVQPVEIEIKYFHLWSRDCGRPGHPLDVERVSALVQGPALDAPAEAWTAAYWYAAAHEGTVCDASGGALAEALRARAVGPYVYVSRGKHASYLARGHCKWGCGSDSCDPSTEPPHRGAVINMGERDAPLNGASWIGSKRWSLAGKLATDFDPMLRARLDGQPGDRVHALRVALRPWQAPILGGDTGLDALVEAGEAASTGLGAAADATAAAAGATGRAVGTALSRTARGIAWFLRLKSPPDEEPAAAPAAGQ
jgi:hypothetical protein